VYTVAGLLGTWLLLIDLEHIQLLPSLFAMATETQRPAAVPAGHDVATKHIEEHAAAAALFVGKHGDGPQSRTGLEFLDSNHRLSSAGEFRSSRIPAGPL
jgi:hypothetical protein